VRPALEKAGRRGKASKSAAKVSPEPSPAATDGLRKFWARRGVQQCAAVLVFLAGAALHYQFAHAIVSVNLENCQQCHEPDEFHVLKTQRDQALVLQGIKGQAGRPLMSHTGQLGEMVSVYVQRGRLDDTTRSHLLAFLPKVPGALAPISLITRTPSARSKTFINISLHEPPESKNALRFFPALSPGYEQPDFKLAAEGLSLSIEIGQVADGEAGTRNADYELGVGDWRERLAGIPVTFLVEPGASVEFRFASAPWEADGLFKPFDFHASSQQEGETGFIAASSAGIQSLNSEAREFDRFVCGTAQAKLFLAGAARLALGECPLDQSLAPLIFSDLKVGNEHVQISAAGTAWAQHHGDAVTVDLVAWLKSNPYLALLLGSLDAAVIAWIKGVFSAKPRSAAGRP